jgi:DNA-binding PadR family transcriptional regulator
MVTAGFWPTLGVEGKMSGRKDSEKIRKSFNRKIVACLLEEIILTHFRECSFSGYDVVVFLQRELGTSLSSATVYGSLYSMERKGLLTGHSKDRKRIFRITELGNLTVKILASKTEIDRLVTVVLTPAKV